MSSATHILLIEDDRPIALALRIRLSAAGHDVVIANSVAEALESLDNVVPDIAVIDFNLPDGNGIELMQAMRLRAQEAMIVCIIMTASRKPGLQEEALQKGAAAFLEKPFPSADLLNVISEYIDHRRAA